MEGVMKALEERYWLPQIRTQKEAVDWLLAEVRNAQLDGSVTTAGEALQLAKSLVRTAVSRKYSVCSVQDEAEM